MNNIYISYISHIPIARLLSPNISKQKPWKRRELRRRLSLALAAATSAAAARRAKGTPGKAVQVDVVEPWLWIGTNQVGELLVSMGHFETWPRYLGMKR